MEDMMEDTLQMQDDDEELEEEADAEVDAVLWNITEGKLGKAGAVGQDLPVGTFATFLNVHLLTKIKRLPRLLRMRRRMMLRWHGCKSSCTAYSMANLRTYQRSRCASIRPDFAPLDVYVGYLYTQQ